MERDRDAHTLKHTREVFSESPRERVRDRETDSL